MLIYYIHYLWNVLIWFIYLLFCLLLVGQLILYLVTL